MRNGAALLGTPLSCGESAPIRVPTFTYNYRYLRIYSETPQSYAGMYEFEGYEFSDGSTNIFSSATTSADSSNSGDLSPNVLDGNLTTYWFSNSSVTPHWITFDLGAGNIRDLGNLDRVIIYGNNRNSGFPRGLGTFRIEASMDNSNWFLWKGGINENAWYTNSNDITPRVYIHNPLVNGDYRYLRLYTPVRSYTKFNDIQADEGCGDILNFGIGSGSSHSDSVNSPDTNASRRAFDVADPLYFLSGSSSTNHWIAFDFGEGYQRNVADLKEVRVMTIPQSGWQTPDFDIEVSLDGLTWNTIKEVRGTTWVGNVWNTYTI